MTEQKLTKDDKVTLEFTNKEFEDFRIKNYRGAHRLYHMIFGYKEMDMKISFANGMIAGIKYFKMQQDE